MKYKGILYLFILAILASCEPNLKEEFEPSSGNADFTTYLSLGNSLTAGYADGALSKAGQENSFPSILAKQMKTVGLQGEFKQPLMPTMDGVGLQMISLGQFFFHTRLILGYKQNCLDVTSLSPVFAPTTATQAELQAQLFTPVSGSGPFNNIGVPGLKSWEATNALLGLNPYYARMKSEGTTVLTEEIPKVNPTFFTLWLGANDALLYAASGGTSPLDFITDQQTFSASMDAVVAALMANGAKGAIANIPDIKSIPLFTTVPYNILVLEQSTADQLNLGYATYNATMEALGLPYRITFQAGPNPLVIADTSMPVPDPALAIRQITAEEHILLNIPQDSILCAGWGSIKPIPKAFTLTKSQVDAVDQAIAGYNDKIQQLANEHGLAHVDMETYLDEFITGMVFDGATYSTKFIEGGLFSLDGVHLNPRGNAIVANHFIDAINAKFNANIPKVVTTDYEGTQFP